MKQETAAIYCRLSVEDAEKEMGREGFESESIRNQRALLMDYAAKRGWKVY